MLSQFRTKDYLKLLDQSCLQGKNIFMFPLVSPPPLNSELQQWFGHFKLLTTILLSSVFTGWVILIIATPRLQRMPKEMRKPMEDRMAIWYRFDINASQHEQLGSSNRSTVLFSIPAPEPPFWPAPPKPSLVACFGGFAKSWLFSCCLIMIESLYLSSSSYCVVPCLV